MDRYTTDLKGTGLLFLSLKPRLLKCTKPSMGLQKNKDIGARRNHYLSVELPENRGGSGCLDSLCQFISGAWRMMPTRRHAVQAGDHYTCPPACVPPTRDVAGPDCKRSGTASPPAWPRGWSHRRGDRPLHI